MNKYLSVALVFGAMSFPLTAAGAGPADSTGPVTFTKDVAPIFYNRCATCHRPGTVAPMSLLTYKDARPWAKSIKAKVVAKEMPPWNADPHFGKFTNDPHLSDREIATVSRWADSGAPEGNPKDLPPAPKVMSGWYIGKPDAVYEMDEDFVVPANQELDMQYFIIDPKFTEDKWVQAVEIVPGDRSVVHHATLFVQEPGKMEVRPRNNQFPGLVTMPDWEFKPSNGPYKGTAIEQKLGVVEARTHESLASLGHGAPAEAWPEGTAKFVPAGSKLVLQVHYHSNGKETKDRSKVGFIFAKQPPERRLYYLGVLNMNFTIPANNPNYEVKAEATLLKDIHIWSFAPHMHLRGKDMKYEVVYPDGKTEVMAYIDRYDFNMQRSYRLVEPKLIPKGSTIKVVAHFDNSKNNKLNPDPNKDVPRGLQTDDEMMNGHVNFTVDEESVTRRATSAPAPQHPDK